VHDSPRDALSRARAHDDFRSNGSFLCPRCRRRDAPARLRKNGSSLRRCCLTARRRVSLPWRAGSPIGALGRLGFLRRAQGRRGAVMSPHRSHWASCARREHVASAHSVARLARERMEDHRALRGPQGSQAPSCLTERRWEAAPGMQYLRASETHGRARAVRCRRAWRRR
jgi:hypothetical protein